MSETESSTGLDFYIMFGNASKHAISSVVAQTINPTVPLENYIQTFQQLETAERENYTILSETQREVSGIQAYEFVTTYLSGLDTRKMKTVMFAREGFWYGIVCGTMKVEYYNQFEPVFENIIQSFRLI